jgi:sugar phosphate permease
VRASAQGLFNVMILGLGALAANSVCPWLMQSVFTRGGVTNFRGLFLVPLAAALFAALMLALFFRPPAKQETSPRGNFPLAKKGKSVHF